MIRVKKSGGWARKFKFWSRSCVVDDQLFNSRTRVIESSAGCAETFSMSKIDLAIKQAEMQKDREMSSRLGEKMNAASKDAATDGLRGGILAAIAKENYERAIQEIEDYVLSKKEFPQYRARSSRYVTHSKDLIQAIRAKRSFPGADLLTMSKQQDLHDRAMEHFEELKTTLRKMEALYVEVKMEDVRSTVWVLKAAVYSIFVLMTVGLAMEITNGVVGAANVLLDSAFGNFTNYIFDKLGF